MPSPPRVAILEKQGSLLSWQHDLHLGFQEVGADVISIQMRPTSLEEYRAKLREKTPALRNPAIIARIARTLAEHRPDLVIFLKQAALPDVALESWRAAVGPRTPFVGWLCDHLSKPRADETPALDGVYYFDSATRPVLETAYSGRTVRLAHLALAANPARYASAPVLIPAARRSQRLVFAGSHTPARRQLLTDYRTVGGLIDSYGPGANDWLHPWRNRLIRAPRLARLYATYFAAFNPPQQPNTINGLNLRAFEVPAAGGLSAYPHVPDLPSLFVPGEEIVAYRDLPDLKQQIDALIANSARADATIAAGHARVLREHTFAHRARRMIDDWLV